jgi:class 3 adenylate cyclase/tetratricopeptide (TPR) repeat protein
VNICPRCGEESPDRARFCLACGAALTERPRPEERKVVSILFVDLVGFTAGADAADPEDVHATLRPYHVRVRQEIERFGGVVEKFVGDAVMAVFGAPVAHEDDAERAVRAGLGVLEVTEELSLQARAAVNSGEALVTLGARPELGEAMVAGDVVNTASRLQSAADTGALVVGESTYLTTSQQIDYEPLEPVAVKGKASPVPLWRALGPRSRFGVDVDTGSATPFVGRDSELTLLEETYARVRRDGAVHLVTLVGEPGVGKTRLVRELGSWLDAGTDLVVWRQGRCLPYGEGITFWALGEIVKAQAGILETDAPDAAAGKLEASVRSVVGDEHEQEWARVRLAPLVGLPGESDAAGMNESFAAWRLYLEGIAAQRPLVVVVEDLHWADQALLEFLDHLLDWSLGVPLLVLCTGRPELFENHPSWGGGKRNSTTVSLSALPRDASARLLHALLGDALLPAETQELLLERCGGNPLYAEQFARMLGDRVATGIAVPETVQAIITARLDALGTERKGLLQDAAVIGKVFWADAVTTLSRADPREVLAGLVDLAHRDLVRPVRSPSFEGMREFSFSHALVRDVAYGQIPRGERAKKHQRAAEWIEATVGERVADHAELIAHHYTQALEFARAAGADDAAVEPVRAAVVRMLMVAGERAKGLDNRLLLDITLRALALASDEERPRVLVKAATANEIVGQVQEADALCREVIPILRERGDNLLLGEALGVQAESLELSGDAASARAVLDEAIDVLDREPPGQTLAAALTLRLADLMMAERAEECLAACESAEAVIREFGDATDKHILRECRGISRIALGDLSGLDELRQALDRAVEQGMTGAVPAYINLGYWTWWVEGPERGADLFRQSIEFSARRAGQEEWAEAELTWALFDLGAWDEVLTRTEGIVAVAQAHGGAVLEAMARPTRGRVLLARGRIDAARKDVEATLAVGRGTDTPQALVPALTLAASVAVASGDHAGGAGILAELEERTRGSIRSRAIELAEAARVGAAAGDVSAVARILADPYPPLPRAEAMRESARAVIAEAEGDLAGAHLLHRSAAERWATFGHVYEHAHALLGAARCRRALGEEPRGDLAAARGRFQALGAIPLVAQVDALAGDRMADAAGS